MIIIILELLHTGIWYAARLLHFYWFVCRFKSYDGNTVDPLQLSIINLTFIYTLFICINVESLYNFSFHTFSILVIFNSVLKMQKKTSNSHRTNLKSKTKHLLAMLRWFVLINDCYLLQLPFFLILIFHLPSVHTYTFFECAIDHWKQWVMPIYPLKRHHIDVQHAFSNIVQMCQSNKSRNEIYKKKEHKFNWWIPNQPMILSIGLLYEALYLSLGCLNTLFIIHIIVCLEIDAE